ncbi:MAG: hypothetical protein AAF355_09650 [Myxococcota bacterium]
MHRFFGWCLLFLAACGGSTAPEPAAAVMPDELLLRRRHEVGQRYALRSTMQMLFRGRVIESVVHSTAEITAIEDDGSFTMRIHYDSSFNSMPYHPIWIAPSKGGLAGLVETQRYDRRGRPLAEPSYEFQESHRTLIEQAGTPARGWPSLPIDPVRVGSSWLAPPGWVQVQELGDDMQEILYQLVDLDRARGFAELRLEGTYDSPTMESGSVRVQTSAQVEGGGILLVEDGFVGRHFMRARLEHQVDGAGEQAAQIRGAMPQVIASEWCAAPYGVPLQEVDCTDASRPVVAPMPDNWDERPRAREYVGASCADRAAEFEAKLQGLQPEWSFFADLEEMNAPQSSGRRIEEPGLRVDLDQASLRTDGHPVELDSLLARIEVTNRNVEGPVPVYLRVDRDERVAAHLETIRALSDASDLRLVVAAESVPPHALSPFTPSWLRERIDSAREQQSPQQRATTVARGVNAAITTCQPAIVRFAQVSQATLDERWSLMLQIAEDARACDCLGIDIDSIEAHLLFWSEPLGAPVRWIALELSESPEAHRLRLSRLATFSDLVARLSEIDGPIKLRAR